MTSTQLVAHLLGYIDQSVCVTSHVPTPEGPQEVGGCGILIEVEERNGRVFVTMDYGIEWEVTPDEFSISPYYEEGTYIVKDTEKLFTVARRIGDSVGTVKDFLQGIEVNISEEDLALSVGQDAKNIRLLHALQKSAQLLQFSAYKPADFLQNDGVKITEEDLKEWEALVSKCIGQLYALKKAVRGLFTGDAEVAAWRSMGIEVSEAQLIAWEEHVARCIGKLYALQKATRTHITQVPF